MKIGLLFGDAGVAVKQSIETQIDNIEVKDFNRISSFMNYVKQSNIVFDRILISTKMTDIEGQNILVELNNFMREYLPRTGVVFIVDDRDTSGIQDVFNNIFELAIYTDATTNIVNVKFILDCIYLKIEEIRELYSISKTEDIDVIREVYEEDSFNVEEESPITTPYVTPILNDAKPIPSGKQAKERQQIIAQIAQTEEMLEQVILQSYQRNLSQGYLNNEHYQFTLADVDPNVLLYKQYQNDLERVIKLNKQTMVEQQSEINNPEEVLATELKQKGYLPLDVYFNFNYTQMPVLTEKPIIMQKFSNQMNQQNTGGQMPQQEQTMRKKKKGFSLFKKKQKGTPIEHLERQAGLKSTYMGQNMGAQQGQVPPQQGQVPPQQGQVPPQQGQVPPQQGQYNYQGY